MRTYFIRTYREEESKKVMTVLSKHVVTDVKRESDSVTLVFLHNAN